MLIALRAAIVVTGLTAPLVSFGQAYPAKPIRTIMTLGAGGTTHHLSGALIEQLQGVRMIHVPYKSGAQGVLDTVSGRIGLMFGTLGNLPPSSAGASRSPER